MDESARWGWVFLHGLGILIGYPLATLIVVAAFAALFRSYWKRRKEGRKAPLHAGGLIAGLAALVVVGYAWFGLYLLLKGGMGWDR